MPKVSVIMPCYNYGEFLPEAVDSVLKQTFTDFELIIVNDGSTDSHTIDVLKTYETHSDDRVKVIHRQNGGLSCARNTGISSAAGEYILLLDADDLIADTFLEKTVPVLDTKADIGIVYCEVERFGNLTGLFPAPAFSLKNMVMEVCITATALYRKQYWIDAGGYDETMKSGMEDHDFWLSCIELGAKPYKINEVLFYYRMKDDSLSKRNAERLTTAYVQLFNNHKEFYSEHIDVVFQRMFSQFFIRLHMYVDTGNGFNPDECIDTVVRFRDGEGFTCAFDLSGIDKQIKSLRFDPTEEYWTEFSLNSFTITNYDDSINTIDPHTLEHNGTRSESVWTFHTTDPFFVLNEPLDKKPVSVTIDATMHLLSQRECDLVLSNLNNNTNISVKATIKQLIKALIQKIK